MNLPQIVTDLIQNTQGSLRPFAPELALCATILLLLCVRLFDALKWLDAFCLTLTGALVALYLAAPWAHLGTTADVGRQELFTGMLVYDTFSIYIRGALLLFAVLLVLLTRLTRFLDPADGTDFYTLILGATLGMCIMSTANHLLTVFLGVEMASVPSYALAGILKTRKLSSEAALKYSVYGAGAAGVMLYGISLLAGVLNSAHLPTMAAQLAENYATFTGNEKMVLALASLMVMVGLAFKLSAVPFHFWCPDVFEGASAEVGAFLSVASKAAALALLVRVVFGLGTVPQDVRERMIARSAAAEHVAAAEEPRGPFQFVSAKNAAEEKEEHGAAAPVDPETALSPVRSFMAKLVAFIAIITCTFGNLAAYGQANIKRLLAYSTIAHAGYMMMAVPAAMAMVAANPTGAESAIASLALYVAIYLFMNLGAFAVVAFLRDSLGSEEIADFAGLIRRCPGLTVCFAIILFSLIGLPPLAGFLGKFAIFAALVDGYQVTHDSYLMLLLWVGGINTAISLFYYLRVVKVMTIDPEPADRVPFSFSNVSLQSAYLWVLTAPLVLLILNWDGLNQWALAAARNLLS